MISRHYNIVAGHGYAVCHCDDLHVQRSAVSHELTTEQAEELVRRFDAAIEAVLHPVKTEETVPIYIMPYTKSDGEKRFLADDRSHCIGLHSRDSINSDRELVVRIPLSAWPEWTEQKPPVELPVEEVR